MNCSTNEHPPGRQVSRRGARRVALLALLAMFTTTASAPAAPPVEAGFSPRARHPVVVERAPEAYALDGVRWGFRVPDGAPEFVRATARRGAVREVFWWSENFPPEWIAAHGGLVFLFDDPAALRTSDGRRSIGLVLSVEARLPVGDRFSLVRGTTGRFRLVHMLTSVEDRLQQAVKEKNHSIDVYRLELSGPERQALFDAAVEGAVEGREPERYHTITNNCVTTLVDLLTRTLSPARAPRTLRLFGLPDPRSIIPKITLGWLQKEGILSARLAQISSETGALEFPTREGLESYRIDLRSLSAGSREEEPRRVTFALRHLLALGEVRAELRARERRVRSSTRRQGLAQRREELDQLVMDRRDDLRRTILARFDERIATYLSLAPRPSRILVPLEYDLYRATRRRRRGQDAPRDLLDSVEAFLRPRLEAEVRLGPSY
jgi:hypothetical protein